MVSEDRRSRKGIVLLLLSSFTRFQKNKAYAFSQMIARRLIT